MPTGDSVPGPFGDWSLRHPCLAATQIAHSRRKVGVHAWPVMHPEQSGVGESRTQIAALNAGLSETQHQPRWVASVLQCFSTSPMRQDLL
jgi:hypothetical protein